MPWPRYERFSDRKLHQQIVFYAQHSPSIDVKFWKTVPKLNSLHVMAQKRFKKGKSFFGYGSWYEYLARKHKIFSITRKGYYDEQLHYKVAAEIAKGTPMNPAHWEDTPELRPYFSNIRNRLVKGKKFFGRRKWHLYLKHEHGYRLKPRKSGSAARIPDEKVHPRVLKALEEIDWNTSVGAWQGRKSHARLYELVKRRKFFNSGGWHGYLRKFVKRGLERPKMGRPRGS